MRMFVDSGAIFLHRQPIDFRKSIQGLTLLVEQELLQDPFCGALYLFTNRARDKIKILYWDTTGFALFYKRLEKNRYKWPSNNGSNIMPLNDAQLQYLLAGFDIVGHTPFYLAAA
jgi:transposase